MRKKQKTRWQRLYSFLFSVYTVVVGVLFIIQCLSIHRSADKNAFKPEVISAHFAEISIFVWLWAVLFVGNILLSIIFPSEEKKPMYLDSKKTLKNVADRLPTDLPAVQQAVRRAKLRRNLWLVATGLFGISCIICLVFLFNSNYQALTNLEFYKAHNYLIDRMVRGLPWLLISALVCIAMTVFESIDIKKDVAKLKAATVEHVRKGGDLVKTGKTTLTEDSEGVVKRRNILRICLAVVGVVLVVVGLFDGNVEQVLLKAINICTQCIGLG